MSHVQRVYTRKRKSLVVAYLFLLFFGSWGAHRYYLKRTESAVSMTVLMGLALFCMVFALVMHAGTMSLISSGLFALAGVWVVIDAVLIPFMARAHNRQVDLAASEDAEEATVRLG